MIAEEGVESVDRIPDTLQALIAARIDQLPAAEKALLHRAAEAANLAGRYDHAVALARLALDRVDAAAEPLRAGALLERLARYYWVAGHSAKAMATIEPSASISTSMAG